MKYILITLLLSSVFLVPVTAQAKKHKPKHATSYTYTGTGSITDVGSDDQTLGLTTTKVNRTLKKLLAGDNNLSIFVTEKTIFSFDGDTNTDFIDVCPGDAVSFTIMTKKPLTIESIATRSAKSVTVASGEQDCDPSIDDTTDDPS